MFSIRDINEKRAAACGVLALAAMLAFAPPVRAQADDCTAAGEPARISGIDIHLEPRLADGRKLRLRGIEPPRGTPGNPGLAEAARRSVAALVEGFDLPLAIAPGERDRWGRHSADIASPPGFAHHPLLAGEIIALGWARADLSDMPRPCRAVFLRLEGEARAAGRGLWGDPAYAIMDAARPETFAGPGGRIVVAEGLIVSTGQWRTLTFLNFGRGRGGPSAVLARPVMRELERNGVTLEGVKGSRVRVRGLLQMRQSPRIEVFFAAAIEILTPAPLERNKNEN